MIDQFDRLKKRNAFVEQYKKENWFMRKVSTKRLGVDH